MQKRERKQKAMLTYVFSHNFPFDLKGSRSSNKNAVPIKSRNGTQGILFSHSKCYTINYLVYHEMSVGPIPTFINLTRYKLCLWLYLYVSVFLQETICFLAHLHTVHAFFILSHAFFSRRDEFIIMSWCRRGLIWQFFCKLSSRSGSTSAPLLILIYYFSLSQS